MPAQHDQLEKHKATICQMGVAAGRAIKAGTLTQQQSSGQVIRAAKELGLEQALGREPCVQLIATALEIGMGMHQPMGMGWTLPELNPSQPTRH